MARILARELLDSASAEDARRNLAELRWINRWLGGHASAVSACGRVMGRSEAFSLLDVGAASGDTSAAIAKAFPGCRVVRSDLSPQNLGVAPHPKLSADAFRLPFRDRAFDVVFSSLFLHHFDNGQIVDLLREMRRVARRAVLVVDLERHWLAEIFLPATRWLLGWHPITLHDGVVSVRAAFSPGELEELARQAGFEEVRCGRHMPWFRLSLAMRMLS